MAITASMVKELRDATGAGMMDAKKALTETDGDFEAAVDWLRTKGLAKAAKKSGRVAAEGEALRLRLHLRPLLLGELLRVRLGPAHATSAGGPRRRLRRTLRAAGDQIGRAHV